MKKILWLLLLLLSTKHLLAQAYQIIHTKTNTSISFEEMAEQLSTADIVIFGEEHNDSIAHAIQLELYKRMDYFHKGHVVLTLEMFERDVQGIMHEYLAGWISEKNFIKESRAWGNYKDYKPLIEYAKKYDLPVICANTPARYTNMVTRGSFKALDKLPTSTKNTMLPPLPIDTLTGAYYHKFLQAMGGHVAPGMFIYQSQNLWDATMAHSIMEAVEAYGMPILHLNGRFHSDEYLGVTARLKAYYGSTAQIRTISAFKSLTYDASLHKSLADYVILTQ